MTSYVIVTVMSSSMDLFGFTGLAGEDLFVHTSMVRALVHGAASFVWSVVRIHTSAELSPTG